MSTEIKDSAPTDGPHTLSGSDNRWVSFSAQTGGASVWAEMTKADFIAAVETELNGIFIPRDELTEVTVKGGYLWASPATGIAEQRTLDVNTGNLRKRAYALLAIAEYADANPPVDQKQVDALTRLLDEASAVVEWSTKTADIARALAATGKVTVTVND